MYTFEYIKKIILKCYSLLASTNAEKNSSCIPENIIFFLSFVLLNVFGS